MKSLLKILLFLTNAFTSNGQNLQTQSGLKYGNWIDTLDNYNNREQVAIKSVMRTIVPVSKYKIKKKDDILLEVFYKKSTAIIFIDKIINDSLSVANGICKISDSSGNLLAINFYQDGILLWSNEYDGKNNLMYSGYMDYESGTETNTKYVNSRIYCSQISSLKKPYNTKRIYYPNDKLILDNAEPSMSCDFLNKPIDTFPIRLSSKEPVELKHIITGSENIYVLDQFFKPLEFPVTILPGQQIALNLLYKPTPYNFKENELVTLYTDDSNNTAYQIDISTYAYHFDYKEVEKIHKLTLSISKDKFLVIPRLGSVTSIIFTGLQEDSRSFQINERINKIDLSQFKPGCYVLSILSCNTSGEMTLNLKE